MRYILSVAAAVVVFTASAQAPAGYYQSCEGLGGAQLLKALEGVVGPHTAVGYNGLWDVYETSDVYPDGTIWDMYSTKHWTAGREQCGTYSSVGDCYNREHSFPKSWFGGNSPMYSDAFHIYPTDGKVNGQRSNYPYGECANGTTLPSSGGVRALGKLGRSTFPGYSGTVFEPDDEYKGDFARSYFYMAACYNSQIDDWDSDMLAGNSYPAFSAWAIDLLLKWHRQDPVSQKEIDRNNAVYAHQHNRNPFIDYPEMAEYVWGEKKTGNWTSGATAEPRITKPADGSVVDLGFVPVGGEASATLVVKGVNLTAPVKITTDADWLTFDVLTIDAATANTAQGGNVLMIWNPEQVGTTSNSVTFTSGSVSSTVTVKGVALDGLVANVATNITDRSFTASWTYIGDAADGYYNVCYKGVDATEGWTSTRAKAAAERCEVYGLEAEKEYEYWVESDHGASNRVRFTTGFAVPSIQLLYDGELYLQARPGQPSQAYELLVDCDNIEQDIRISVSEPFELSSDKQQWGRSLVISPLEDRFYMRLYCDRQGIYSTVIELVAGDYVNDAIEVYGAVSDNATFCEDFEADAEGCSTYNGCDYNGTAASWHFDNAGIWASDKSSAHSGEQCLRMGKSANSCIEMTVNKGGGIGTVELYACRWSSSDGDCELHIEYSTDNGATWQATTSATVTQDQYEKFTFTVNTPQEGRIRVQQTAGARFIIDDITITDFSAGLEGVESDYRSWDAFCRQGLLVMQMAEAAHARIYGVDGIVYFDGIVAAGETEMALPEGLYVIAVADFSRRVLVK